MKFSLLILPIVVLLSACEQSQLEKSARAHAEVQAGINVRNFERAERSRQEESERREDGPDGQDDQKSQGDQSQSDD
jgi:hypothetical protein